MWVWVWVRRALFLNCPSVWSIHQTCQFRYDLIEITQPVWVWWVVSLLLGRSIYWFLKCSCYLLFDNRIVSKSHIQHSRILCSTFFSLHYQLFLNPCVSIHIVCSRLPWQSILPLWSQVSVRCLDCPIYMTTNNWCSIDFHIDDGVI